MRWPRALLMIAASLLACTYAGGGFGAYPLGPESAAMWLSDEDSVLFFVFFVGDTNWHDRKWKSDTTFGVYYNLVSDSLTLSIRISADGKTISAQGQEFSIEEANVLIVDVRKSASVTPLGVFDMPTVSEQPSVLTLLDNSPQIIESMRAVVLGDAPSD